MHPTRIATVALVLARVGYALGLISAPRRLASPWVGSDAERPATQIALRGLAGRDLALAGGALSSLDDDERLTSWLAATAFADLSDLAATLAAPADRLPDNARRGALALAGGAAAAGVALIAAVRRS